MERILIDWRVYRHAVALVGALVVLGSSPAMAQFRIEFQPQRRQIVVSPRGVQPTRTYTFGARSHVDDLALQLERQANAICLEMYRSYQHNPGYRETYREMYQVLQDAKHIHELVHDRYHRSQHQDDHIAQDLVEMDSLVHHIEDDIARWAPARRFSDHGHHVHGPVYGQGNLQGLMHNFAETLHHLMSDYGVKSPIGASGEAPPPEADVAPPPQGGFPPRTGRR